MEARRRIQRIYLILHLWGDAKVRLRGRGVWVKISILKPPNDSPDVRDGCKGTQRLAVIPPAIAFDGTKHTSSNSFLSLKNH